jgi:diguanylate cyclase (GGDEF)-like protein
MSSPDDGFPTPEFGLQSERHLTLTISPALAPDPAAPSFPAPASNAHPRPTDSTLREQMQITELEIERRKAVMRFTQWDAEVLADMLPIVTLEIDAIIAKFYDQQTSIPEIALVIGDAETLRRLHQSMRGYILDLFSGEYGADYVNKRLRIGLVHTRIGVPPKLYLCGIYCLRMLLNELIERHTPVDKVPFDLRRRRLDALDKLMYFDNALVFDTYIRSLMRELEVNHLQMEEHAAALEETVTLRTKQLEAMSRTDSLTGLLNRRVFDDTLQREMKIAARTRGPVTVVFFDLDGFKTVNDEKGHAEGDRLLTLVGDVLLRLVREGESAFRLGGDEFAIIMPRTFAADAEIPCRRIGSEFHKACNGQVRSSFGIAETGLGEVISPDELLARADAAMYAAKRSPGGPVKIVRAPGTATPDGNPRGHGAAA